MEPIDIILEINTEKKLALSQLIIHLLQKELTRSELIQLTAYLLVIRYRKVKDLKKLFPSAYDFLYLLVAANLHHLKFPFAKTMWQTFSEKAMLAQGIDATAQTHLQRFDGLQADLERIARNPAANDAAFHLREAKQYSAALSHTLVIIKSAQAQTNKVFQNAELESIALLLPLYHEYQNANPQHPKAALQFLIQFLDFSIYEVAKEDRIKAIRNLLINGQPLESLANQLAEQNEVFDHISINLQAKATLLQSFTRADKLFRQHIEPVQQRLENTLYLMGNLLRQFPKQSESYLALRNKARDLFALRRTTFTTEQLSAQVTSIHHRIDACMKSLLTLKLDNLMPLHWLILNPANHPQRQRRCIEILLQEGADPRLELNVYKRKLVQKGLDCVSNLKQSLWLDALRAFWVTPMRTATELAQLLGQKEVAKLLSAQEMRLFGKACQPLGESIPMDTAAPGFLPAFATSFKHEGEIAMLPEQSYPQPKISMP